MEEYRQGQGTSSSLFSLNLDASNSHSLQSAASWAKILAVCGFIMGVFCAVLGFVAQKFMANSASYNNNYSDELNESTAKMASVMGLILYLAIGVIFVIGSIFVLNFGNRITKALQSNDSNALASGFSAIRNYFAFWTIVMILLLLLLLMSIAGLAIAGR